MVRKYSNINEDQCSSMLVQIYFDYTRDMPIESVINKRDKCDKRDDKVVRRLGKQFSQTWQLYNWQLFKKRTRLNE